MIAPVSPRPDDPIDDPWNPVARETIDAVEGRSGDPGNTADLVSGRTLADEGHAMGASTEMVDLLSQALVANPDRTDLWLMRFEMHRTLGMKGEFAAALLEAWAQPRVRRTLDWSALQRLWDGVAPGEPLPAGIELTTTTAPRHVEPTPMPTGYRRFSDIALRTGTEALQDLRRDYAKLRTGADFFQKFARTLGPMLERPTPLHYAERLSQAWGNGNARIYLKREERRHVLPETENACAQAYIAQALGKKVLVTGSDVPTHALVLAQVAPQFGLKCIVFVAAVDREASLIVDLKALGATVEASASRELLTDDPREAALHYWLAHLGDCHLALSLGGGPPPYPNMIADLQSLLGREAELQWRALAGTARPRCMIAAISSAADAIGFMLPQLARPEVKLYYAEAPSYAPPSERVQAYGNMRREFSWLRASGRLGYVRITDDPALIAQEQLAKLEDVDTGLEDARALAVAAALARKVSVPCDLVTLVA